MASIRSNIASMRNCSGSTPPSSLTIEFRRKPVATTWSWVASGQQVAGDLLDDEPVVGQVAVEGVDDPVAIEPDVPRLVLLEAVGVGVPGRVEPVPAPALAVVRARQQAVDQPSRRRRRDGRRGTRRPPRSSAAGRSGRGSGGGSGSTRSASGEGLSPSASSRARTKRSIGFRTQPRRATAGRAGRVGGLERPVLARFASGSRSSSGQVAPWSIQARSRPTCSAVSRSPLGGMIVVGVDRRRRARSADCSALRPARSPAPRPPP